MPATKDHEKRAARKLVWNRLREFLAAVMPRFKPAEELLKNVEARADPRKSEDR
jgi:hypothetical protein